MSPIEMNGLWYWTTNPPQDETDQYLPVMPSVALPALHSPCCETSTGPDSIATFPFAMPSMATVLPPCQAAIYDNLVNQYSHATHLHQFLLPYNSALHIMDIHPPSLRIMDSRQLYDDGAYCDDSAYSSYSSVHSSQSHMTPEWSHAEHWYTPSPFQRETHDTMTSSFLLPHPGVMVDQFLQQPVEALIEPSNITRRQSIRHNTPCTDYVHSQTPSRHDTPVSTANREHAVPRSTPVADVHINTGRVEEPQDSSGIVRSDAYAHLLYRCLLSAPGHKMSLKDIYTWMEHNCDRVRAAQCTGWQNSVRHNLSMNKGFERATMTCGTASRSKKTITWQLTEEAIRRGGILATTSYRRRVKRGRGGTSAKKTRTAQLEAPTSSPMTPQRTPVTPQRPLRPLYPQYLSPGMSAYGSPSPSPSAASTPGRVHGTHTPVYGMHHPRSWTPEATRSPFDAAVTNHYQSPFAGAYTQQPAVTWSDRQGVLDAPSAWPLRS